MGYLETHGWIAWIIIGGIAGAIAKLLMPGKDPGGCIVTVLLGICGAVLAGFVGQAMNLTSTSNGAGSSTHVPSSLSRTVHSQPGVSARARSRSPPSRALPPVPDFGAIER